jgi:arabinogalactan oligomer/maltooligosaccharide transport system permease protein
MAKNPAPVKIRGGMRARRVATDVASYILLSVICLIWIIPFVYLVLHSFRAGRGQFTTNFFPEAYTLDNYIALFTDFNVLNFPRMFVNTLTIATCSCIISTFFVLAVSYCLSRVKWKMRRPYMNMAMVINLFPGFMSMMAVYFLLKAMGMTEGDKIPLAMIICFSSGAGTGFFVMKGYMDTIPKALDEAAYLDGATRWQTFTKITLPLCKPMIVYQVITSFMGPWVDFVFAKVIARANAKYFTVSIGLFSMLEKEYVDVWYVRFCAGAVLVAIPISILFLVTQKFYQEAMSGSVKG